MTIFNAPKIYQKTVLTALTVLCAFIASHAETGSRAAQGQGRGALGVIRGTVRDESGNPIANAYVSFFKVGSTELLKQVRSTQAGEFLIKMIPGTYTILAVAEGFNPVSYRSVEIGRATDLSYKFKLERAGSGNTLPEKRLDRNSSKWRIRAAQIGASIYQNREGAKPVDDASVAETAEDEPEEQISRKGQSVVETYVASSNGETFGGINFATLVPIDDKTEVVLSGQTAASQNAPQRFEARVGTRLTPEHLVRINASIAKMGRVAVDGRNRSLGQVSFQALDEWRARNNVVLVLGFDYSKFVSGGSESSLSPRFGLQFDADSKTRIRTSLTTQNEEKSWSQTVEMEGSQAVFKAPTQQQEFAVVNGRPLMNRSTRFETGVERLLDSRSSIEANFFLDLTSGRGVGLINMPIGFLSEESGKFVANQQGRANGVRLVYSRRINGTFSTAAGYAFGNGQKLSKRALKGPSDVFENDNFQTFFGQLDAAFGTGTQVKTVFRLSPQATVFAIDPFKGRMTIYDPGLSVVVTQTLPTLGLPIRAQAIIDARNMLDFQSGINGDEGSLRLSAQRRALFGGIMVRF